MLSINSSYSRSEYRSELIFFFCFLSFFSAFVSSGKTSKIFFCCTDVSKIKSGHFRVFLWCQPNQSLKRKNHTYRYMRELKFFIHIEEFIQLPSFQIPLKSNKKKNFSGLLIRRSLGLYWSILKALKIIFRLYKNKD